MTPKVTLQIGETGPAETLSSRGGRSFLKLESGSTKLENSFQVAPTLRTTTIDDRLSPLSHDGRDEIDQRSFTAKKLDWMTVACAGVTSRDFKVAFTIAQHMNASTNLAMVSDETISDKTKIPKRTVARARKALRERGWIDWKRTKTANLYWILQTPVNAVLDQQIKLKDERDERRKKRRARASALCREWQF